MAYLIIHIKRELINNCKQGKSTRFQQFLYNIKFHAGAIQHAWNLYHLSVYPSYKKINSNVCL